MSEKSFQISDRRVGFGQAVYVIAELSANHGGSLDRAIELVHLAAANGADAIKLQTYTADTMTLPLDRPPFIVGGGTPWTGRQLFELYEEASTPWDWHRDLFREANSLGLHCFSTPFDQTAVEFLEGLDPPAYKVASFELLDHALIERIGTTGRPVIISTGMATAEEIDAAVAAARRGGTKDMALLRCNSAYPAPASEMDLRTIEDMVERWGLPVGLSDHTLGDIATIVAVAKGACIVEKHLTWSRAEPGPDSSFSLEPLEFGRLVARIREVEAALGSIRYGPSPAEEPSLAFRRSLWFVRDLAAGSVITEGDVAALRPAGGLPPSELPNVIGRRTSIAVERGMPVDSDALTGA